MRSSKESSPVQLELTEEQRAQIGILYRMHAKAILAYLSWRFSADAQLAQDILHQAFLHLCAHPEKLAGLRQPRAWLLNLVANAAIDTLRAAQRRSTLHQQSTLFDREHTAQFWNDVWGSDWLSESLERLPEREKRIALGRWLHGWTMQRLAREEETSVGSISNILGKIIEKLRVEKRL